jgi:hypothetical protein
MLGDNAGSTIAQAATANLPPFVDRVADKVRTLAAVKPALVRLLEWQIDTLLDESYSGGNKSSGFGIEGRLISHSWPHDGQR